ncbi:MAG: response regulator transcription factor [Anaerolineales bacterium]|jgi:DNA-binding NarL/FixJ family response regulator
MVDPTLKILVVDDNPATRRGLRLLLSLEDDVGEILEASGGKEAERLAAQEHPNVVLLDVRMPGMSGIETARLIKNQDPNVHLVAMSMVADSKTAALGAGADLFVEKTQLVAEIRSVLDWIPQQALASSEAESDSGPDEG